MGAADICSNGSSQAVCVLMTFMFAFPGSDDVRFGENVFCHFALKVIHLFWMSFFETRVGIHSDGGLYGGLGMGVRTRRIWI